MTRNQANLLSGDATRGPEICDRQGRALVLRDPLRQPAGRTWVGASRSNGRSRDLTILDGDAPHRPRPRPAQTSVTVRVLLAESLGLVRAGLRSLLERERDISVASEASSGEEAVALATDIRPDVVLMDMRVAGIGGLAATRRILADPKLSQVRVVILTAEQREEDLYLALRSGASGFLLLDTDPAEMIRAVRVVAGGGAQLSPWATRQLLQEFASRPDPQRSHPELFDELTARERHIVSLVALGLSNVEISQRLVVSPATVKTHVSRAMLKLHVRDRAKLVALAYQTGFVQQHRAVELSVAGGRSAPPLTAT